MRWTWRDLHPRGLRWEAGTPHYATPSLALRGRPKGRPRIVQAACRLADLPIRCTGKLVNDVFTLVNARIWADMARAAWLRTLGVDAGILQRTNRRSGRRSPSSALNGLDCGRLRCFADVYKLGWVQRNPMPDRLDRTFDCNPVALI